MSSIGSSLHPLSVPEGFEKKTVLWDPTTLFAPLFASLNISDSELRLSTGGIQAGPTARQPHSLSLDALK